MLIHYYIVTRNRPESLERTLKSVLTQVDCSLIFVSDDSDVNFTEAVAELCIRYGVKYIKGPRLGLYSNRNHCFNNCKADYIRFIDDDHTFPELHFTYAERFLEQNTITCIAEMQITNGIADETIYPPLQLGMGGFGELPNKSRNCPISDGAIYYPKSVFKKFKFIDTFNFGQVYQEFGQLLYQNNFTFKSVTETYVIHHINNRSFNNPKSEWAARVFSMISASVIFPRDIGLFNRILMLLRSAFYFLYYVRNFDDLMKILQSTVARMKGP